MIYSETVINSANIGNRISHMRQRISSELEVKDCAAYLANLWLYAATYTRDGVLNGLDATDIAFIAGWEYEPTPFIDTMLNSGVLCVTQAGEYAVGRRLSIKRCASELA